MNLGAGRLGKAGQEDPRRRWRWRNTSEKYHLCHYSVNDETKKAAKKRRVLAGHQPVCRQLPVATGAAAAKTSLLPTIIVDPPPKETSGEKEQQQRQDQQRQQQQRQDQQRQQQQEQGHLRFSSLNSPSFSFSSRSSPSVSLSSSSCSSSRIRAHHLDLRQDSIQTFRLHRRALTWSGSESDGGSWGRKSTGLRERNVKSISTFDLRSEQGDKDDSGVVLTGSSNVVSASSDNDDEVAHTSGESAPKGPIPLTPSAQSMLSYTKDIVSLLIIDGCKECEERMGISRSDERYNRGIKENYPLHVYASGERLRAECDPQNWTYSTPAHLSSLSSSTSSMPSLPQRPDKKLLKPNNNTSVLPGYLENIIRHHTHIAKPQHDAKLLKKLSKHILLPEDPSDPAAFTVTPGLTRTPKPPWCSSRPVLKIAGTFAVFMSLAIIVAIFYMSWFSNSFRPMHL